MAATSRRPLGGGANLCYRQTFPNKAIWPVKVSDEAAPRPPLTWFLKGVGKMASVPAVVLMSAQVGFAALARDAGLSLSETIFLIVTVWALPAQVVFVGSVLTGAGWVATIVAVTLSSVRFLPMLMAWTPVVRSERSKQIALLAASHVVAVTSWVFSMSEMPKTPQNARLIYFAGFAVGLVVVNVIAASIGYLAIGHIPGWLSAGLLLLTPLYFLLTLSGAGRMRSDHLAMVFGLCLGPLLHILGFGLDLLWAGVVGGTLAYLGDRLGRRARR